MSARLTQRDRILDLLRRNKGQRVPSPELARISLQYGARTLELRRMGYRIASETERVNGQVHGYFILQDEPTPNQQLAPSSPIGDNEEKGSKKSDSEVASELGQQASIGKLFEESPEHAAAVRTSFLDHEIGRHTEGR